MQIKLYQVTLVIESKERRLTKAIAKQFPVDDEKAGKRRWRAAEKGEDAPAPICKVQGKVLGLHYTGWMYLVPDEEAGLVWVRPLTPHPRMAETIIERGGWVDHPEEVPTAIL